MYPKKWKHTGEGPETKKLTESTIKTKYRGESTEKYKIKMQITCKKQNTRQFIFFKNTNENNRFKNIQWQIKKQAQSKGRWAKTNHIATASKSMPNRGKIHTNTTTIVHKTTMGKLKTNMGTKFKISKISPLISYKANVHWVLQHACSFCFSFPFLFLYLGFEGSYATRGAAAAAAVAAWAAAALLAEAAATAAAAVAAVADGRLWHRCSCHKNIMPLHCIFF